MYSTLPNFVLGFHGCDQEVGEKVLSGADRLSPSINEYDWLGNGIYFWENNPSRALEYATLLINHPKRSKIKKPFSLGAIIDLGYCLNLIESKSLQIVKQGYRLLCQSSRKSGFPIPKNKPMGKNQDLLLRNLDCSVIETIHTYNRETEQRQYDSVRGVFWEGKDLYPNAGFKERNHMQICVRNPNCIKGYFRPLAHIDDFDIP